MKFKGTLWLALGFLTLVLYYYLVDIPQGEKEREDKERSEKILLFEEGSVEEFSLSENGQTIQLTRRKDDWELTQPVQARGDRDSATSFLNRLKTITYTRVVDDNPEDLRIFGLSVPSIEISLTLKNKEKISLSVGDNNPLGHSIYVKRGNENKVLLTRTPRKDLEKSVYDLRNKSLMDFDTHTITEINIERKESHLIIKKSDDTWTLSDKITATGNPDDIMSFLNSILSTRIKKFIDESPEALTKYGLDNPSIRLNLTRSEGKSPLTLLVGKTLEKDGYYAKMKEEPNVVLLSNGLFTTLSRKLEFFLDKNLVDFKEDEITQFEIWNPEEKIRVVRDKDKKGSWKIESPFKTSANTATVNSLLFDLNGARIEEFITTLSNDHKFFGLSKPKHKLILSIGGKPWILGIGNKTSDGKYFFSKRNRESFIFKLSEKSVSDLLRPLKDLRNRKIFNLKMDQADRIELKYSDNKFVLQKNENDWRLLVPEGTEKITTQKGNDIIWTLNALEFESIVEPPIDEKITRLDVPALTLSVFDNKNRELAQLKVGKKVANSDELIAHKKGSPSLHNIKARFLQEIPDNINEFKK